MSPYVNPPRPPLHLWSPSLDPLRSSGEVWTSRSSSTRSRCQWVATGGTVYFQSRTCEQGTDRSSHWGEDPCDDGFDRRIVGSVLRIASTERGSVRK